MQGRSSQTEREKEREGEREAASGFKSLFFFITTCKLVNAHAVQLTRIQTLVH